MTAHRVVQAEHQRRQATRVGQRWLKDVPEAMDMHALVESPTPISGDHKPLASHDPRYCLCNSLGYGARMTCDCGCHVGHAGYVSIWEMASYGPVKSKEN